MEGCLQPLGSCRGGNPAPSCSSIREKPLLRILGGQRLPLGQPSQRTPPCIHSGRALYWENTCIPLLWRGLLPPTPHPSAYCGAPGPTWACPKDQPCPCLALPGPHPSLAPGPPAPAPGSCPPRQSSTPAHARLSPACSTFSLYL